MSHARLARRPLLEVTARVRATVRLARLLLAPRPRLIVLLGELAAYRHALRHAAPPVHELDAAAAATEFQLELTSSLARRVPAWQCEVRVALPPALADQLVASWPAEVVVMAARFGAHRRARRLRADLFAAAVAGGGTIARRLFPPVTAQPEDPPAAAVSELS